LIGKGKCKTIHRTLLWKALMIPVQLFKVTNSRTCISRLMSRSEYKISKLKYDKSWEWSRLFFQAKLFYSVSQTTIDLRKYGIRLFFQQTYFMYDNFVLNTTSNQTNFYSLLPLKFRCLIHSYVCSYLLV